MFLLNDFGLIKEALLSINLMMSYKIGYQSSSNYEERNSHLKMTAN